MAEDLGIENAEAKEEKRKESFKAFLATINTTQENKNQIMLLAERWADAAFDYGQKL